MSDRFRNTNMTFQAIENLHTVDNSFKSIRYIDRELANYTKLSLQLRAKKSGNLTPTQLDSVLSFHSSLRSQIILDPFSMEKHKALFAQISEIDLGNLVNSSDQSLLMKMSEQASILMDRHKHPGQDFLENIISHLEGSLLVTFRRESTIHFASEFFSRLPKKDVFVDSLSRKHAGITDNNLIFGPIHWFSESILSNPRGLFLFAAMPAHLKFRQPEMHSYPRWFNFGQVPIFRDLDSTVLIIDQDIDDADEEIESTIPIVWNTVNASKSQMNESQSLCRQFALANGKQVFIGIDGGEQDFVHSVEITRNGEVRQIEINPRDLRIGNYIILREGQSDTEVLYSKARELIGSEIDKIESNQAEWKGALKRLLQTSDLKTLNRLLQDKGLKAVNRLNDWTNPSLRRPLRDNDFIILLQHLKLDVDRYMTSATKLRRAILQVASTFRQQLESAISLVNPEVLLEEGHYVISAPVDGVAGLFISKIIGVSSVELYVDSQRIRIPFNELISQ